MVGYKRKQNYKARPAVKRRRPMNYIRKSRIPRAPFRSDIHYFRRMAADTQIAGNIAHLPYQNVFRFSLNNLPNVSDFVNLFDHYSIIKVVTKLWLKVTPAAQAAASASYPKLYYCRDTDDSAFANLNELRQHGNTKVVVFNPNRPITLVCKPNILFQSFGTTSNYTPKWNQWIDMGDTTTPHYAWKFCIDDLTNTNYRVDVEHTFYFKCKHAR